MESVQETVDVAVIGVGRMGRHHARTYKRVAGARLVAVVDADIERAGTVADEFGCEACASMDELLAKFPKVRAASVAVPTAFHLSAAAPLLRRGVACLVEKPMASTVAEARELAAIASGAGALLQIGHTERFNPAVRAVVGMNIRPRFMEVHRVSPMSFRSLDVGVVMDMMIHDLDIVLTLAGSPLMRIDAAGVAVMGQHEDVVNARMVFRNGCVANLTASRLALKTERKLRVFSEDAYVSLDYQKRNGVVIHRAANANALDEVRKQLEAGSDLSCMDYSRLVTVEELKMSAAPGESDDWRNDPLTAELMSFVDAVRTGSSPEVDAAAGFAAVDAAERVVAAIRAHRWEGIENTRV